MGSIAIGTKSSREGIGWRERLLCYANFDDFPEMAFLVIDGEADDWEVLRRRAADMYEREEAGESVSEMDYIVAANPRVLQGHFLWSESHSEVTGWLPEREWTALVNATGLPFSVFHWIREVYAEREDLLSRPDRWNDEGVWEQVNFNMGPFIVELFGVDVDKLFARLDALQDGANQDAQLKTWRIDAVEVLANGEICPRVKAPFDKSWSRDELVIGHPDPGGSDPRVNASASLTEMPAVALPTRITPCFTQSSAPASALTLAEPHSDPRQYSVRLCREIWRSEKGENEPSAVVLPTDTNSEGWDGRLQIVDAAGLVDIQIKYGIDAASDFFIEGSAGELPWFVSSESQDYGDDDHYTHDSWEHHFHSLQIVAIDDRAPTSDDIQRVARYFGIVIIDAPEPIAEFQIAFSP